MTSAPQDPFTCSKSHKCPSPSPLLPPHPKFQVKISSRQMRRAPLSLSLLSRSSRIAAALSSFLPLTLTPAAMEDTYPTRSSPISTDVAFLATDSASGSQIGSAPGSLKADGGVLGDGASGSYKGECAGVLAASDAEFGFQRAEMGQLPLAGSVGLYERHVFLCYKSPEVWPSHVEAAEFDRLPRLLSAALAARKGAMKKKTRLTICGGEDGTDASNGDVLIFPDMIRYRRLTHFDVDNFVEEVLVKDTEWLPGAVETLTGSYIFVCAHGSRDKRCGVCGPPLIKKIDEEISNHGLQDQVFVSPCSHIGGHKYAGNVIIFSPNINGEVTGHWYGYVAPDDVPILLEQHIGKGEIIDHLWRGQMGLSGDDQKNAQRLRNQLNIGTVETTQDSAETTEANGVNASASCCQGVGNVTCCQNMPVKEKVESDNIDEVKPRENGQNGIESKGSSSKEASTRKICRMPTWFECWEREDTYAALAVASAVASVVIAYSCYRQLK